MHPDADYSLFKTPLEVVKPFEEMYIDLQPIDDKVMGWMINIKCCDETKSLRDAISELQLNLTMNHQRIASLHTAYKLERPGEYGTITQDVVEACQLYAESMNEYKDFKHRYEEMVDHSLNDFGHKKKTTKDEPIRSKTNPRIKKPKPLTKSSTA
jgi:hypothetical protein